MADERKVTISVAEFFQEIPDEHAARVYIERLRWPNGVICPHCESESTSRQSDYRFHRCLECRKRFTVRTGTIYHRPYVPLHKWLYVAYLFEKNGDNIDSEEISEELDVSERSAYFMLHRLREVPSE